MKCIYTAIFGDYDYPLAPRIPNDDWDFLLFTDNPKIRSNSWETIVVPRKYDIIRSAREVKIMFHKYVGKYDVSIWTDANIRVNQNLANYYDLIDKVDMVTIKHPCRNDSRAEARACKDLRKDNLPTIDMQISKYGKDGYKFNNGLIASGVMMRRNVESVRNLCEEWWAQVKEWSHRDQISFNYALWKNPVKYAELPWSTLGREFKINGHRRWL